MAISYRISPKDSSAHLFEVLCTIREPDEGGQIVTMPAWIPGSYMIRDFAKNVVRVWARCEGKDLAVVKLDKKTWRCEPCQGPLELRYEVQKGVGDN